MRATHTHANCWQRQTAGRYSQTEKEMSTNELYIKVSKFYAHIMLLAKTATYGENSYRKKKQSEETKRAERSRFLYGFAFLPVDEANAQVTIRQNYTLTRARITETQILYHHVECAIPTLDKHSKTIATIV